MADLIDHNRWPKDIYRIQKTDYIQGGSDGVINIHSHAAIAKDDSIDVDDNTTNIIPGMRLLLADAEHCEEIEIRDVLERGRIRTVRDLQYTYNEPTQIGYTNWTITEGNAD